MTHSETAQLVVWRAQNGILSVPVADRAFWPEGGITVTNVFQSSQATVPSLAMPIGVVAGVLVLAGLILLVRRRIKSKAPSKPVRPRINSIQAMTMTVSTFL
jgi:hypothetical protein